MLLHSCLSPETNASGRMTPLPERYAQDSQLKAPPCAPSAPLACTARRDPRSSQTTPCAVIALVSHDCSSATDTSWHPQCEFHVQSNARVTGDDDRPERSCAAAQRDRARPLSCAGDWFLLRFTPLTDALSDAISLIVEKNTKKRPKNKKHAISISLLVSSTLMLST